MFEDTKHQVAIANRILVELGLCGGVTASLGHVSQRVPGSPDRFIVKGRGYKMDALTRMKGTDMVVCDLEGFKVEAPEGVTQCYEVKIHSTIYRTYPDVQAVVHGHPRFTTWMGSLKRVLHPLCNEGAQLVRQPIPVFPHNYLIQSDAEGMGVAKLLDNSPLALLRGHGMVAKGPSMEQCVLAAAQLEEQARLNWQALCALGPDYPYIEEDYFTEPHARVEDLTHFTPGQARGASIWTYYSDIVSRDM